MRRSYCNTYGQLKHAKNVFRNLFKIRAFFVFVQKLLENKVENPIQIYDNNQVFSNQIWFVKE